MCDAGVVPGTTWPRWRAVNWFPGLAVCMLTKMDGFILAASGEILVPFSLQPLHQPE